MVNAIVNLRPGGLESLSLNSFLTEDGDDPVPEIFFWTRSVDKVETQVEIL